MIRARVNSRKQHRKWTKSQVYAVKYLVKTHLFLHLKPKVSLTLIMSLTRQACCPDQIGPSMQFNFGLDTYPIQWKSWLRTLQVELSKYKDISNDKIVYWKLLKNCQLYCIFSLSRFSIPHLVSFTILHNSSEGTPISSLGPRLVWSTGLATTGIWP